MEPLSLRSFFDHLDTFGADLTTWPAALRSDAIGLLANSKDARLRLEKVQTIEGALRAASTTKAPAELKSRIIAAAAAAPREPRK